MDYESWIEGIDGLASLYSFDIMEDGTCSEIRLMAVNKQNVGMLQMNPEAPEFYPGIPYRTYWMDLNFESFVYKCGTMKEPLYSYVNARGVWLKGFYLPITKLEEAEVPEGVKRTAFCLYVISYSDVADTESMSQKSTKVSNAIMEISIKLHETRDYYQDMAGTVGYIKEFCGAEKCSFYTVDRSIRKCALINERGLQTEYLKTLTDQMNLTPYELAEKWEEDLALSDCLLLDNLRVIQLRDPVWYGSLSANGIRNLILYAVRYNQKLVGFIWAANYDTDRMMEIKETLELSTFLLATVVANHQLVSRLKLKSTIDELTQVNNRNAMNDKIDRLDSGEMQKPETMGVVFVDLNGLKVVNDDQGHETGDMLLKRAAALLKIAFSGYDIYRAGGDEFVILCPYIDEEKMESLVSQLKGLANNTPDVSFAVGTKFCSGEYDISKAIQAADEVMYKDKKEFYDSHPEMDRRRSARAAEAEETAEDKVEDRTEDKTEETKADEA